jgi:integrase
MGTIVERKRSDGSTAFTAQIVVKQNGRIVYREAKTLDRKQAAYAWLEKREKELKAPGGFERKDDVPFRKVIARYLDESEGSMGRTKAAYLKKIMESNLGSINCGEMTSDKLVAFARTLPVKPQTRANYFSHLSPIFAIATPAWKYPLSKQEFENALESMKRLKLIAKSAERDRRPTLAELDRLMEHFAGRRTDSAPMQKIIAFAIFSTRRQEEITRLEWGDLEDDRILVRAMKDPKNKQQNNVRCELTPEALKIINSMARLGSEIFPFSADAISSAFTKACKILGIEDLHFHDLRHEGISRLFEMGRTIPQVAAISGHRSWSSLKRYTHIRATGNRYQDWKWLSAWTYNNNTT